MSISFSFQKKYLKGISYVEVRDHGYKIHPTKSIILKLLDPPTSLRTQYNVQNETQFRRKRKVNRER